jgi:hypothetical protein
LISAAGAVSAAGNIVSGQFFVGNGSALTGVLATGVGTLASLSVTGNIVTGNLNTTGLVSTTGNVVANNLSLTTNATVAGNLTVTGAINLTSIDVPGGVQVGALYANTVVSAAGNVTGDNFFANSVTSTGNVSGANLIASVNVIASGDFNGLGNVIINPGGGAANSNKGFYWGGFPSGIYKPDGTSYDITIRTNNLTVTGIGEGGNILVGNVTSNNMNATTVSAVGNVFAGARVVAGGNVSGTNLLASQTLSATGNITGGNLIGSSGSSAVGVVNYRDYVATITYASTITPNIALGSIQQVTLTGNVTLNAFGGTPQAGQSVVLKLIQDATGSRILTSTMKWAGGNKTLSTAANAVDIASIFFDGTTYWASLTLGYT